MDNKNTLLKVQSTMLKVQDKVKNLPLDGLLTTAEGIAGFLPVPYLDKVIKLLRLLIRWRPLANSLMGVGTQTVSLFSASGKTPPSALSEPTNDEAADETKETADILSILDEMVEIAAEDGDLSPEEEKLLVEIAQEAGISESAVLAKVKMKCLQKQ